jgi:hypothetical protein
MWLKSGLILSVFFVAASYAQPVIPHAVAVHSSVVASQRPAQPIVYRDDRHHRHPKHPAK